MLRLSESSARARLSVICAGDGRMLTSSPRPTWRGLGHPLILSMELEPFAVCTDGAASARHLVASSFVADAAQQAQCCFGLIGAAWPDLLRYREVDGPLRVQPSRSLAIDRAVGGAECPREGLARRPRTPAELERELNRDARSACQRPQEDAGDHRDHRDLPEMVLRQARFVAIGIDDAHGTEPAIRRHSAASSQIRRDKRGPRGMTGGSADCSFDGAIERARRRGESVGSWAVYGRHPAIISSKPFSTRLRASIRASNGSPSWKSSGGWRLLPSRSHRCMWWSGGAWELSKTRTAVALPAGSRWRRTTE